MHLPLPRTAILDLPLPNYPAEIAGITLSPPNPIYHEVPIESNSTNSSFDQDHRGEGCQLARRLYYKAIQSELLCIHGYFEDLGWVGQLCDLEDGSSALLGTVTL